MYSRENVWNISINFVRLHLPVLSSTCSHCDFIQSSHKFLLRIYSVPDVVLEPGSAFGIKQQILPRGMLSSNLISIRNGRKPCQKQMEE